MANRKGVEAMVTFDYEKFRRAMGREQSIVGVREFGDKTGIQFTRLWRITKGIYNPTVEELCAICTYIKIPPEEFLRVRMLTEKIVNE